VHLNLTDGTEENESHKNAKFMSFVPAILHTSKVLFIANAKLVCGHM
jgi:hypothetical protein